MTGADAPIVVVEWECLSPLGLTAKQTWDAASQNRSGLGRIDRYDPLHESFGKRCQVTCAAQIPLSLEELAGSAAKLGRWTEPAQHGVQRVVGELLGKLGFDIAQHDPQRVALLGGSALTAQHSQERAHQAERANPFFILGQCHNLPLSEAAKAHGIQGPSFSLSGACASSAQALFIAWQLIRAKVIDCAVVVGFDFPILPITIAGFDWLNTLYRNDKPDDRAHEDPSLASRPFAMDRRGFVLGEAVAAVLIADPAYAGRHDWPVKARILGACANSDAHHLTRVSVDNIAECMRGALRSAAIDPERVDCVNAHATSTPVGDHAELQALQQLFGERLAQLPVVANKSQLGHSLGASSLMALILAGRGMAENAILPTLNHVADPSIPTAFFPPETLSRPHGITLLNSFGFGGTNAAIVLGAGNH